MRGCRRVVVRNRPGGWSGASALAVLAALACTPEQPTGDISGVELLTPEKGWSLHLPPFEVPPGTEVQDCYFFTMPDLNGGEDYFINRFKLGQRTGSHHLNVFRVKTIVHLDGEDGEVVRGGECRQSPNWADWPLVVNSQESSVDSPIVDWQLPPGVGQRFSPGEKIMVQSHYVNADLQVTPGAGEVRINFYLSQDAQAIEMGTLFATQQSIRVCRSNPNPTFEGTCSFPGSAEIHLAAMNGHFHSRGSTLKIYDWDGVTDQTPSADHQCYESASWDEPPMTLDLDVRVPAGGGVWWSCEYQWQAPAAGCADVDARDPQQAGDCCYTFGNSAEYSEHCNVFVYYWPKVDSDVFCN